MSNDDGQHIRLIAFTERPMQEESVPILLHVYVVNESPAILEILNDLDSINIPQAPQLGSEKDPYADFIHIDFGVSELAKFIQVAPAECVKITLILREEELVSLVRVKQMRTGVKFRNGDGEVTSVLFPVTVYKTNL